jgi:hypothetical protein
MKLSLRRLALIALVLPTAVASLPQCSEEPGAGKHGGAAPEARTAQDPLPQNPQQPAATPPPDALRVLLSGAMLGRLEPCGCASGQLGGLARRVQHIGEQRTYDLLVEGGDLLADNTELDVLKLFTATQVLFSLVQYDALGVGAKDLMLPRAEWSAFLAGAPVLATNLRSAGQDGAAEDWPARTHTDKVVRGVTVRLTSLLLPPPEFDAKALGVGVEDPAAAYTNAHADADPALRRIVLVHGGDVAIRALIPSLQPAPDLVVGVDPGYVEPTASPQFVGDVPLVFVGIRGRVLLEARLWREGAAPRVTTELVPLAASKTLPGGGGDPQVRDILLDHRRQVKADGLLQRMAHRLPAPGGNAYVGTNTCRACHPSAYDAWAKSKHAHAWETLVKAEQDPKRYGWPVTAYPDCVSCHVVGYGEETGFVGFEQTPQLADVGCEQCHGPGSAHVAAGGMQKLGLRRGELPSIVCTSCHDFEQSPTFVYGERWSLIEHGREKK